MACAQWIESIFTVFKRVDPQGSVVRLAGQVLHRTFISTPCLPTTLRNHEHSRALIEVMKIDSQMSYSSVRFETKLVSIVVTRTTDMRRHIDLQMLDLSCKYTNDMRQYKDMASSDLTFSFKTRGLPV